jgi:hypothetical protein
MPTEEIRFLRNKRGGEGVYLRYCLEHSAPVDRRPALAEYCRRVPIGAEARALRKRGSGGVSLPATSVAAGADFTIADDRHVANVSNESSAPHGAADHPRRRRR